MLRADDLAKLLRMSKRTVFRYECSGRVPAPLRIGGSVRWLGSEIQAWLDAGAPDRKTWETLKGAKNNGGN